MTNCLLRVLSATLPPTNHLFDFLEDNPVLIGIFSSMVVTTLELFLYNRIRFKNNRYLAACVSIYPKLNDCLNEIEDINEECSDESNPYLLVYPENILLFHSLKIPFSTKENCFAKYNDSIGQLYKLFSDNASIPCPRLCRKSKWDKSMKSIKEFVEILHDKGSSQTSSSNTFDDTIYRVKWTTLKESIQYVIRHTNRF